MNSKQNLYILTPVYNDWESLQILIQNIEQIDFLNLYDIRLIIIDDGSTLSPSPYPESKNLLIEIVHLKTNVGHQRSIAIGLQYIANTQKSINNIIVMDSDGEDRPEDIPELLIASDKNTDKRIVFAKRNKRNESRFFRFSYIIYKLIFKIFTGFSINYGNFSCIPHNLLGNIIYMENIWNHFAGSIIQSNIPLETISLDRGTRYAGSSKMNLNNLIIHGLSAISIYFDLFTIRILKASFIGTFIGILYIIFILYQKLILGTAIPGWASSLILIISGVILQLFTVTIIVVLLQLSRRKSINPPNSQLYKKFIKSIYKK